MIGEVKPLVTADEEAVGATTRNKSFQSFREYISETGVDLQFKAITITTALTALGYILVDSVEPVVMATVVAGGIIGLTCLCCYLDYWLNHKRRSHTKAEKTIGFWQRYFLDGRRIVVETEDKLVIEGFLYIRWYGVIAIASALVLALIFYPSARTTGKVDALIALISPAFLIGLFFISFERIVSFDKVNQIIVKKTRFLLMRKVTRIHFRDISCVIVENKVESQLILQLEKIDGEKAGVLRVFTNMPVPAYPLRLAEIYNLARKISLITGKDICSTQTHLCA